MKQKTIIKKLKTSFSKVGSGKPIVLIHGWGCDLSIFNQLQNELAKTNEVYAIDLPGFGLSETPPAVWGVAEYADFLKEFIESQNINDPILLGHSFGGKISMQYAYENKVSKLILTGSSGVKPRLSIIRKLKMFVLKFFKNLTQLFLGKRASKSVIERYRKKIGSVDYRNADGTMREILVNSVGEDLTAVMPLIQAKTLIIWGKDDADTPLLSAHTINNLIPNTELQVIPNAGHFAFLDQKDQFINYLKNFLDKN